MKGINLLWVAVVSVTLAGCQDRDGSASKLPLFQSHFIGMTRVIQGTNASRLKEVWALPASQQVRREALDKIASAPFRAWKKSLPTEAQENSKLIRPLLDDLITSESVLEFNGARADYDSVIAISLNDERARLWNTNLWQIVAGWKLGSPRPLGAGTTGWEARGHGILVQVLQSRQWLFVGWSLGKLKAITALADATAKSGRPVATDAAILDFKADFPSLSHHNDLIAKFKLPVSHFVISPHRDGESLRTEGEFSLAKPLNWTLQPWHIPTNHISDPLVSFSVAQGIEPLLRSIPGFDDLKLNRIPDQVCAWSQGQGAFNTYWAFENPRASNLIRQLTPHLTSFLKHYHENPPGGLIVATNRAQVVWQGLPLMLPFLEAISEGGSDYLLLGLMPALSHTKPAPSDLFEQFERRPDLLYYDWEITQDRLFRSKLLYQAVDMSHLRRLPVTNAVSVIWPEQVAPHLGNTVTEISKLSPKDLKFVRKSHIGFTGFELATFLRWIESPAFPLGYEPAPAVRHPAAKKKA